MTASGAPPTPDELAAMPMSLRRAAVASIDFNAMADDEAQAYAAAVMAPEPPAALAETLPHIRARIPRKRGNTFYRVKYSEAENGSRTLCGAEAGLDYTWAEGRTVGEKPVCPACKTIRDAE